MSQPMFPASERVTHNDVPPRVARRTSSLDKQVGGNHYKKFGKFQPWVVYSHWFSDEELFGFMKGTVIGYLARTKTNSREDAEKAMHTIQLYLELSAERMKEKANDNTKV